jgi:hypothetical protein
MKRDDVSADLVGTIVSDASKCLEGTTRVGILLDQTSDPFLSLVG